MNFQDQAKASVDETTESAQLWLKKGRKDRALRVVRSSLSDAEAQIGKITIPGASAALEWGIGQLKVLLTKIESE